MFHVEKMLFYTLNLLHWKTWASKTQSQKQLINYYQCILQLPFLHLNVPYICVSRCSRRWDHMQIAGALHRKKGHEFSVCSRNVTNQTPPGQEQFSNDVIIPAQGEFGSDIPAGDGKLANLFFTVYTALFVKKRSDFSLGTGRHHRR